MFRLAMFKIKKVASYKHFQYTKWLLVWQEVGQRLG